MLGERGEDELKRKRNDEEVRNGKGSEGGEESREEGRGVY